MNLQYHCKNAEHAIYSFIIFQIPTDENYLKTSAKNISPSTEDVGKNQEWIKVLESTTSKMTHFYNNHQLLHLHSNAFWIHDMQLEKKSFSFYSQLSFYFSLHWLSNNHPNNTPTLLNSILLPCSMWHEGFYIISINCSNFEFSLRSNANELSGLGLGWGNLDVIQVTCAKY